MNLKFTKYFHKLSILLLSMFLLLPSIISAQVIPPNLSVPITEDGVISSFSVTCQATSTNATALLLTNPNNTQYNPFHGSLYAYMRKPCVNGTAIFDSYNLKAHLEQSGEGGYDKWSRYFQPPFNLVVKDTTGLYTSDAPLYNQVISLVGGHNNYNYDTYRLENEEFKTLGYGTAYFFEPEISVWTKTAFDDENLSILPSNVLFFPGLEASRLYKDKSSCVLNCQDQLWEPNGNADVEDLYLDDSGNSVLSDIYTKDIIDETKTPFDAGFLGLNIYKSFINQMNDMKSNGEITDWKPFAYDWREDLDTIITKGVVYKNSDNNLATTSMTRTFFDLSTNSKSGKVTIIAHSNGGLLAKRFIQKLYNLKLHGKSNLIDRIDRLILVAVPQIGTPSAIPAMLHGYDQTFGAGFIMDEATARGLGKNMKSAYGLLPTKKYFEISNEPVVTFATSTLGSDIFKTQVLYYGDNIKTYNPYKNFVLGLYGSRDDAEFSDTKTPIKLRETLFNKAETLGDELEDFDIPSSVEVIKIAGWGINTVSGLEYYPKPVCKSAGGVGCELTYIIDQKPIWSIDGDKTVLSNSALVGEGEKWLVNLNKYNKLRPPGFKINHSNIIEVDNLLNAVKSFIKKQTPTVDEVFTNIKPVNSDTSLNLSVHSPVNIGVYDTEGNFTGKVCPTTTDFCYKKEDIANSSYTEFGEGKYINLPKESFSKTTLTGYDTGTFTYITETVLPDGTSTTTIFSDIPVTKETKAEVTTTNNNVKLSIDTNSDGKTDIILNSGTIFDPIEYLNIIKVTVQNLDLNSGRKTSFIKRVDSIIKAIQKGKIDKAKLKAENFKKTLNKRLSKPDTRLNGKPIIQKPGRLTKTDAENLLKSFEEFLNNLN